MKKFWVGLGLSVAVATGGALWAASSMIAPGVSAAGVDISGLAPEQARSVVVETIDRHPVRLGDQEFTLGELGYELDQGVEDFAGRVALAGRWGEPVALTISTGDGFLSKVSGLTEPVSATVTLADGVWVVTPSSEGHSLDAGAVEAAVESDINRGDRTDIEVAVLLPEVPDDLAASEAEALNDQVNSTVVKVGGQGYPVPAATVSGLFTVEWVGGVLVRNPVVSKVDEFAQSLTKYDSEPVSGEVVVDGSGKVLSVLREGSDGVTVAPPERAAEVVVEALVGRTTEWVIPVVVVPRDDVKRFRRAEVDLATNHARFYENEKLVHDFPVAVGADDTPTDKGDFRVHTRLAVQDMGCGDPSRFDYCLRGVRWITYYNTDEGFHSAPWAKHFGQPESKFSHGCINMRTEDAKAVFDFLVVGSPVAVR